MFVKKCQICCWKTPILRKFRSRIEILSTLLEVCSVGILLEVCNFCTRESSHQFGFYALFDLHILSLYQREERQTDGPLCVAH